MKWYIIAVRSNFEEKIKRDLEESIEDGGLQDLFSEVLVPTKIVDNDGKDKKVNHYRGYVFVHMKLTDASWSLVKNTKYVSDVLGSNRRPTSVPQKDIDNIKAFLDSEESSIVEGGFSIDDSVNIVNGPFASFAGKVVSIDNKKAEAQVEVMVFSRPQSVILAFSDISK